MLRTRPWRYALTAGRRLPALAAAGLAGGVILGFVAASPSMFTAAVGSGAVQTQWDRGCPGTIEPHFKNTALTVDSAITAAAAATPGFLAPNITAVSEEFTFTSEGGEVVGALLKRPGASEQLEIIDGGTTGDLWISDTAAEALQVGPGALLTLGDTGTTATVRGVFRDLTIGKLNSYWCGVQPELRAATLFTDIVPPPKAIIDPSAGDRFDALLFPARYIIPFATQPRTLADARRLTIATQQLEQAIADETAAAIAANPDLQDLQRVYDDNQNVVVAESIGALTRRSEAVERAVGAAIRPMALLAVGCTLAVVTALGVLWSRLRRNDLMALTTLGVAPGWIGLKAALELLPALALGTAAGALTARAALAGYAPSSTLEPGTWWATLPWLAGAAIVALVAIGAVAAASSRSVLRALPRRLPIVVRWLPVELVVAAAAWRSYRSFRSGSLIEVRGDEPVVNTTALSFPLLCIAAAAILAARCWYLALRRGPQPIRTVAGGLALRRLQFSRASGAAFVATGALAMGIATYGAGLVGSLAYTRDAKAGVFVGSDLAFRVRGDLPADVPGATPILFRTDIPFEGRTVDILAVDPSSFASVAFWDETFADQSLTQLLGLLAVDDPAAPAPAVIVDPDGQLAGVHAGALDNSGSRPGLLSVDVAATARMFPGVDKNPLIVISRAAAERSEFNFENNVWARGELSDWVARLREAGVEAAWVVSTDDVINASELLFASWTFSFVRALGAFVCGLVALALLLQLASRQRRQAIGFGILRRMNVSQGRHRLALTLEVAALAVAMGAAGVAGALLAARAVTPRLDPLPIIPPGTLNVTPVGSLLALVAIAMACSIGGAAVAQRLGARLRLAEALRND